MYMLRCFVFQSTLPQRERRCNRRSNCWIIYISIHAPAKGATCSDQPIRYYRLFQSTLPQRERLSIHNPDITALYFNPRSRKGSDNAWEDFTYEKTNFNPRSRKGSDMIHCQLKSTQGNFNPRSRKGSDSNISQNNELLL